ncbi:hypothetical protein ACZ11_09125 [Lysinibacillus xylanilyticus]|uniref:Uncharacterized protein n=1 Tax=Lysinibacillus xylanilyticus TaxID=582475 RepID=A0A0K9FCV1_9BACI|nr:hypothetical protein [Lysinibacillus xylanilyticus]KMY32295.1 hypothetical protein ACZ11_09125 [Lysinibacillus xylanilyticus]
MERKRVLTSENLSLIGEPQLIGFTHTKERKLFTSKPGKYGWHFWGESVKTGDFFSVKGTHQLTHKEFEWVTDAKVTWTE